MKPIKTFKIGSRAFFEGMQGYEPKDTDELCIMDEFVLKGNSLHANGLHGKDVFFYRNMSKEAFINETLESSLAMKAGKFLVPEFAKHLGLTMDDLRTLEPKIRQMDKKHSYEKVIFDSYLENGDFYLTDEQRKRAFEIYLDERK